MISCGKDESGGDSSKKDNFNRKQMLTFWADNIIIPAYSDFSAKTKLMDDAIKSFADTPSNEKLVSVVSTWKTAYISWQKASLFQIGKAQEFNMTATMNTYPTNVDDIKEYVASGTYNLESPNLYKAQGFPALDYLLNGMGTAQETVDFYKNATNANYVKYLKDISARVNNLATQVYNDWKGNYRAEFIDNDGYTTVSSVDKMVNFYVIPFYEKQFREFKLAIPSGARTGTPVANAVEAFYAKNLSKELFVTTLTTVKNFFKGVGYNGSNGQSLKQYLEFLNRKDLADEINNKFATLTTLSNDLEDSFINQIANDKTKMLNTFDAIQEVLKKFKPDMMSAMSVMNTSTDIDND